MNLQSIHQAVNERLQQIDFTTLWPGFQPYNFAVYNNEAVCLRGEMLPKTDTFLANTAIEYEGEWIAIFMVDGSEDLDRLTALIVHEMFHAHQRQGTWVEMPSELDAIINYEYTLPNLSGRLYENQLLVQMIQSGYDAATWERLLASKQHRHTHHNYSYRYEAGVEQIEGTANYVEYKALAQLDLDKAQAKLDQMITSITQPANLLPIRIHLYSSGALLIMLMVSAGIDFNPAFDGDAIATKMLDDVGEEVPVEYPADAALERTLEDYTHKLDQQIERLTQEPPIVTGEFPLLGVNVYDATHHRGYIYTTYFLSYQDGEEPVILHGNYLIKMAGDKVVEVYGG